MKITRILIIAAITVFMAAAPLYAQDEGFGDAHVYTYPKIQPTFSTWVGAHLTDWSGSTRAGEYINLEDSVAGGLAVTAFPFPHRFHWELDVMNGEDYFSDMRYSFKDLVMFRAVNRSVYHNSDDITLVKPDGRAPINDPTDGGYGYRAAYGVVHLRLKAPNYPAHAFVDYWYMDKDGDRQQRRMGKSAYHTDTTRITERRTVDLTSKDVTAGLNGHLGPVEAQYSHTETSFKAEGGIASAAYTAATGIRAAGTYPHSILPKLEGSADTFKVHTSYTGRLVASATFITGDEDNKTGGAKADHYIAAGEVVWTPMYKFTAALRYRYEDRDVDNPDSLPAGFLGFNDFTAKTGIRNTVTAEVATLTAMARYRPTNKITVGADATFRSWDRDHAAEWGIKEETEETILGASLSVRALKNLKLKLRYRYKTFDDPAHNNQPDDSHKADIAVNWTPVSRVMLFTSYSITEEQRSELHTMVGTPLRAVTGDRSVSRNALTAMVTVIPRDNLSLSGGYAYWGDEIKQDIAYGNTNDPNSPFMDPGSSYKNWTTNYSFATDYSPIEQLDLHGGVNYTKSRAGFTTRHPVPSNPISISTYSKMAIRESSYELGATYKFPKEMDLGVRFEYRDFEDILDNQSNPETRDGSARIFLVTFNKRW